MKYYGPGDTYDPDVDDGSDDYGTDADDMTGLHETVDPD